MFRKSARPTFSQAARAALALSLGLAVAACGGVPTNRTLESVHQPVVQRNSFVFDAETLTSGDLSVPEQRRLAGWFEALGLRYGDRISIDDPLQSNATRASVEAVAARYGMLVTETAPITAGPVAPGAVRVVVNRTVAEVPGCPDWKGKTDANPNNATHAGYGCAVNGNLAAMVADKEHLVRGASSNGETVVMSSSKAIESFRDLPPSGKNGLKQVSSQSGGN